VWCFLIIGIRGFTGECDVDKHQSNRYCKESQIDDGVGEVRKNLPETVETQSAASQSGTESLDWTTNRLGDVQDLDSAERAVERIKGP
jgi:hypothetical protein